jgi:hypothetical protein
LTFKGLRSVVAALRLPTAEEVAAAPENIARRAIRTTRKAFNLTSSSSSIRSRPGHSKFAQRRGQRFALAARLGALQIGQNRF